MIRYLLKNPTASILQLIILQLAALTANASLKIIELELNENTTVSIRTFAKNPGNNLGDNPGNDPGARILWLPSEFGIQPAHDTLLSALSQQGFEVWLSELHDSYFLPSGRKSYTKIPPDEIAELIKQSIPMDDRPLFIVATGRAAALALSGLNNWQSATGGSGQFSGLILLQPNLQSETPKPGQAMRYLSIIDNTQLPVFIIQPKRSEKFWYLDKLVTRLNNAGSKVFTQVIEQASDG